MTVNRFNFKAFCKKYNKVYRVQVIDFLENKIQLIDNDNKLVVNQLSNNHYYDYFFLDDVILLQSTGILDEKGVEMFEGDIIRNHFNDYFFIKFNNYHQSINLIPDSDLNVTEEWNYGCYIDDLQCGKEVVGNIYENQDILERRRIYGEEYREGFERTELFYPHKKEGVLLDTAFETKPKKRKKKGE